MASPSPSGRILRIEDADRTTQKADSTAQNADATAQNADSTARAGQPRQFIAASKPCVVPGCTGTMDFHERHLAQNAGPAHWEFPWYASWRCRQDSAHFELVNHAEEREIVGHAFARAHGEARLLFESERIRRARTRKR